MSRSFHFHNTVTGPALLSILMLITGRPVQAQTTEADVAALKLQSEMQVLRKTIAEAERAELLAKLPPSETKALAGSINSDNFGTAANIRAFDLAKQLALQVCADLPAGGVSIYNPAVVSGIVSARVLDRNINYLTTQIAAKTADLRKLQTIDPRFDDRSVFPAVTAAAAGIKAVADVTSLFKTDVTVTSKPYGEDTKELFISALAEGCGNKVKGLGSGYLGDLDATTKLTVIDEQVVALIAARNSLDIAIAETLAKAEKSTGASKQRLTTDAAAATTLLKSTDAFVISLKLGETGEQNPVYSAARYLTYDARTSGLPMLDFKLNLEGLAIKKTNIFTGQRMRLSGVAFLWYRLMNADGTLISSKALRRLSRPIEVDLRGTDAPDGFFDVDSRGLQ